MEEISYIIDKIGNPGLSSVVSHPQVSICFSFLIHHTPETSSVEWPPRPCSLGRCEVPRLLELSIQISASTLSAERRTKKRGWKIRHRSTSRINIVLRTSKGRTLQRGKRIGKHEQPTNEVEKKERNQRGREIIAYNLRLSAIAHYNQLSKIIARK